ncbi:MAG TPA: sulfatase-like hydrolase/transferase, partial [Pirellulales bacterium]
MSAERPAAVVCLVVDRLHAGYLGSYGNAWIETPELDRLAAESTVFDSAFVARPTLESLYPNALWLGRHPLEELPAGVDPEAWAAAGGLWGEAAGGWEPLPATLQRHGVETILVSDDAYVSRVGERYFGEVARVAPQETPAG